MTGQRGGSVLIGLDVGTQVLKAAAFDAASGDLLARTAHTLPIEVGDDGRRETPMDAIDRTLSESVTVLRTQLGSRWTEIRGMGVATQGGSTIICERSTGRALTPMVLWNDARCYPLLADIQSERARGYWRRFSLRDVPGMGLARLRWLEMREPCLLSPSNMYAGVGEYVVHRLTGRWLQDACNAAQTGIYDARRDALTAGPLAAGRPDLTFFAPLRRGHETHPTSAEASASFGLPESIEVAGPYNDHEAGFASVVGAADRPMLCSLGTAWVGTFMLPEHTLAHTPFGFVLPAPVGGRLMALQPLLTGNVTWDWALARFSAGATRPYAADVFEERVLPRTGLVGIPWLNRPNLLAPDAVGAAAIVGLGPATDLHDLLRAVAGGMCFEFARMFSVVRTSEAVGTVILAGGASRGRHFQHLLSSLFSPLPVVRIAEEDLMGVRGSLFAFGGPAARIGVTAVEGGQLDPSCVAHAYRLYCEVFRRLAGDVPVGGALQIRERRMPPT